MNYSFFRLLIISLVAILVGCAAKPIVTGDSAVQQKNVIFPKVGQQVHAVQGGLVHLRADYSSRYAFRLVQSISMSFMLGRLNVTNQDFLVEATLETQPVFCTVGIVWSDLILGPRKRACFIESKKGTFDKVKVAPGEYWFTKDITPPVTFVGSEIPLSSTGKPLKKELIFEGQQNGNIFFTEKSYESNLETPSKVKPVLIKAESTPSQINVDGVIINVISFTANSLTFSIEKPWD